ncbi:hypothetical protein CLBCK_07670 [Clostridium beijerinckii]|uniref:Bacteriocin n=2 Tax=Clostridium beijerinckii TaxID=1520 RepID=A0A1S8SFQ2_CLOBE|nr:hypothetical protein CLBCK_07670 [Clostridium beijerinckii]
MKYAIIQGIFCVLFIWLFFDNRKDSKAREIKYQSTIDKNQKIINELAVKFNVVEDIKDDVELIKSTILL